MTMAEKEAHTEACGIAPLEIAQSSSQQLQSSVSVAYSPTTTITPDFSTSVTNIAVTNIAGPLPSFGVSKESNSQVEVAESTVVTKPLLMPGLLNTNAQFTSAVHNVSVAKEVASGSFLFGPSDDGFGKDHNPLLCASDSAGNTIPLPVRQSSFSDANPLTPVRSKVCTGDYTDQGAPLTPTANLKLLLSAASPAIRERELMQQNTRNVCRSILTDADATEEFEYSRKQKSLSILCTRFLEAAENGDIGKNGIFTIEEASTKLDINRRRVYDIVNVLESLEMVSKQKIKNEYKWHGRDHLVQTLSRLKEQENGSGQHALDYSCAECGQEYGQEYVPRSEKSLGYLCQKFVMLFLDSPEREMTLEAAARILLGEEGKVRRLYDVANILTSLGLISKKGFGGGTNFRKPGFYWSGPTVFPKSKDGRSKSDSDEILQQRKQQVSSKSLASRSSVLTPIENLPAMKTKSPRSAPSSPVKQKTPLKRYLSFDTSKKRRLQSTSKTPEVRKLPKLSPQDVPEKEVKEFEDQLYALLGKYPTIAAQWLPELQSKQGDVNTAASIYAATKKAYNTGSLQGSSLFQDGKAALVSSTSENKENWSTALSEQALPAKMQSPSIAMLASRAMNFPVTKGIVPLPLKNAITDVTPSSLCQPQLVTTTGNIVTTSDGLITVTPLYTTDGHNVIVHKSISSTPVPSISPSMITSMAASLLSAACKPSLATNIPTVGELLQSNQLFAFSQKTEQNTTTA